MIRFHLDENASQAIAHGLKLRDIDVTTTNDANLVGKSDLEQIAYCVRTGRVIFTQDQDFLRHHHAGIDHAGIVYSRQGAKSTGEIIRFLQLLCNCLEPKEMRGQVEFF